MLTKDDHRSKTVHLIKKGIISTTQLTQTSVSEFKYVLSKCQCILTALNYVLSEFECVLSKFEYV